MKVRLQLRRLTHQSSGHAPASRVMPLISNVRHHKFNGPSTFKKLSSSQYFFETLSRHRLADRRENIAFFRAAVIRTTEQVLSAGSPSVCSSLLKSVYGAVGLGVALGELHSVSGGSQTNGKSKSSVSQLGRLHTISETTVNFRNVQRRCRFGGYIQALLSGISVSTTAMPNTSFKRTASPPLKSNVRPHKCRAFETASKARL